MYPWVFERCLSESTNSRRELKQEKCKAGQRFSHLIGSTTAVAWATAGCGEGQGCREAVERNWRSKFRVALTRANPIISNLCRDAIRAGKLPGPYNFRGGDDGIRTHDPHALPPSGVRGLVFTVEQLELMLAEARRREKGD